LPTHSSKGYERKDASLSATEVALLQKAQSRQYPTTSLRKSQENPKRHSRDVLKRFDTMLGKSTSVLAVLLRQSDRTPTVEAHKQTEKTC
jgi:hypothetical protein